MDASVIISYINSEQSLPILLDRLEKQDYPREKFEVILINGDDWKPRLSQGAGQMEGFRRSKGDIIFLIDSDRYPPPNWISTHMKLHPRYDLVAGNVIYHRTKSLQALNFGNISMSRAVLDAIPIRDISSQQDCDFAFRFIKQSRFKGTVDEQVTILEPPNQQWNAKHHFLMARNIMVLRKHHRVRPQMADLLSFRHPADLIGSVVGLFSNGIANAHV